MRVCNFENIKVRWVFVSIAIFCVSAGEWVTLRSPQDEWYQISKKKSRGCGFTSEIPWFYYQDCANCACYNQLTQHHDGSCCCCLWSRCWSEVKTVYTGANSLSGGWEGTGGGRAVAGEWLTPAPTEPGTMLYYYHYSTLCISCHRADTFAFYM